MIYVKLLHPNITLHAFPLFTIAVLFTYFGVHILHTINRIQINPNNPGNVEDLQRTAEAHCVAFGISNMAGMCQPFSFTAQPRVSFFFLSVFFFCKRVRFCAYSRPARRCVRILCNVCISVKPKRERERGTERKKKKPPHRTGNPFRNTFYNKHNNI